MPSQGYQATLLTAQVDGTAKTATAAASILPGSAIYTFPPNFFDVVGKAIKIKAHGRISCVVTTPGTVRLDLRLGGNIVFDSGALNLNVVAKTNVPWMFEAELTLRAIGAGTSANFMGFGNFTSEAVVGSAANTAGGNGSLMCPVGAPAVGGGFNSTASNALDMFHTQTVSTGSIQVHAFRIESLN